MRRKIQEMQTEIGQLGTSIMEIPEMIESTNLLRKNEFLTKSNDKKTELLLVYEQYSEMLEALFSSVFGIQNEFKEILKEQSSIVSDDAPENPTPAASGSPKTSPMKKPGAAPAWRKPAAASKRKPAAAKKKPMPARRKPASCTCKKEGSITVQEKTGTCKKKTGNHIQEKVGTCKKKTGDCTCKKEAASPSKNRR